MWGHGLRGDNGDPGSHTGLDVPLVPLSFDSSFPSNDALSISSSSSHIASPTTSHDSHNQSFQLEGALGSRRTPTDDSARPSGFGGLPEGYVHWQHDTDMKPRQSMAPTSHTTLNCKEGITSSTSQPLVSSHDASTGSASSPSFEHYHRLEQYEVETQEEAYFDRAHSCSSKYVAEMGAQTPLNVHHLFKPPMIRQWLHGSYYFGETSERQPSRGEMLFDLVYSGIINQLSVSLGEAPPHAIQVGLFTIKFFLAWILWQDQRMLVNQSGSDDVLQRAYLVLMMILSNAFISNVNQVRITTADANKADYLATRTVEPSEPSRKVMAQLLSRTLLFSRSDSSSSSVTADPQAHLFKSFYFADQWRPFLQGALGFWFVARGVKMMILSGYALKLPNFRAALLLQAIMTIISSVCFLPLLFLYNTEAIMILSVIGVLLALILPFFLAASLKGVHKLSKRRSTRHYFPAQSVEHTAERTTLFTVLVIGETIMNCAYVDFDDRHSGWDTMFGRASLSLLNSFLLAWVYFDSDGSRTFVHALRRHYLPALQFANIHAPLCAGVIVSSAVIPRLVEEETVDQGTLWYYSGGLATALVCIALIACLHESLDLHGSAWFSTNSRIAGRLIAGITFFCLPIKSDWKTVEYLGVQTIVLAVLVAFETMGKIGAVGRVYDADRSKALHEYQEAMDATRFTPNSTLTTTDWARLGVEPKLCHRPKGFWARWFSYYPRKVRAYFDKEYLSPGPSSKQSWHNYEDLSYNELGEEDVGNEVELGQVAPHKLRPSRRWALTAF